MPTLFEISADISALHDLLTECGGELPDVEAEAAIDQWLAETDAAREKKIDGYCGLIREFEARSDAREIEANRLLALAGADGNQAKRLRARLKAFFEICDVKRMETPRFRVSIQANGGLAPLLVPPEWETAPATAPERFHRRRIELDKDAIRDAIENGDQVDGCSIAPRGNHLRIR